MASAPEAAGKIHHEESSGDLDPPPAQGRMGPETGVTRSGEMSLGMEVWFFHGQDDFPRVFDFEGKRIGKRPAGSVSRWLIAGNSPAAGAGLLSGGPRFAGQWSPTCRELLPRLAARFIMKTSAQNGPHALGSRLRVNVMPSGIEPSFQSVRARMQPRGGAIALRVWALVSHPVEAVYRRSRSLILRTPR